MMAIVGIGSPHGDDQLGWIAVDRLRSGLPAGIATYQVRGGIDLLDCLEGRDSAILIDAAAPSGRPGTIRSFVWPCPGLAAVLPWSTHGLGLCEALQLAESLGRLPRALWIHTIEAGQMESGAPPSPGVLAQLDVLIAAVRRRITGGILV